MLSKYRSAFVIVSTSAVLLSGCGDKTLLRLSQDLSNKAVGSSTKVQKFYANLRADNARMRTEEVRLQPEAATALDPATPGPVSPISDEDMNTRIQTSRFIETYCVKLNALVRSKNPQEMEQAIADANSELKGFNIKNFNPLDTLRSAGSPFMTTLRIIGKRGFAVWADNWLKKALASSATVFEDQSKLLKQELNADAQAAQTRATKLQGLAERTYRKSVAEHASDKKIKECQTDMSTLSALRQTVGSDNPSSTYDDLSDVHRQLMNEIPAKKN